MRVFKISQGLAPLIFVVYLTQVAVGCGITTHIEIGHRSTEFFSSPSALGIDYRQLILEHQDAFQAGNPYPDAYYPSECRRGLYHDVSEDTHWAPFLSTTVQYIRTHYPPPWDDETKKLVVFMLGFVSHQVADISWHSLGIDQGFLATMGMTDFHGSFEAAHDVGDFGGDILNQFQLNLDYVNVTSEWYVPVGDLFNIYKEYYKGQKTMDKAVIEDCTLILFLARLGEKLAVAKLFPDYANKSPFLVNQLSDYFLGGMNDMAVWTTNIWRETIYMLENGQESCDIPRNPLYLRCHGNNTLSWSRKDSTLRNGLYAKPYLFGLTFNDVIVTKTKRGVYFKPKHHLKVALLNMEQKTENNVRLKNMEIKKSDYEKKTKAILPTAVYSSNVPYTNLGRSLISADINNDGFEDLVLGSPGYSVLGNPQKGRVYIVYGNSSGIPKENLTMENQADVIMEGFILNGRYGWSVAVVDLNADGLNDLVVSAPSVGSTTLTYKGEVYVYFGSKSQQPFVSTKPDIRITCPDKYCNLGYSLASGDLNRDGYTDLVVGSPFAPAGGQQKGMVGVIYAKKNLGLVRGTSVLSIYDCDWMASGEQNYSWYGYRVAVKRTSLSGIWLMVGSPTYRLCALPDCTFSEKDIQSVGKLYIYDQLTAAKKPRHTFTGKTEQENLGYSFAIGDPYEKYTDMLAISQLGLSVNGYVDNYETFLPQVGGVSLYNVSVMLRNVKFLSAMFYGDRLFDKYGANLMFEDLSGDGLDDLIVASPFRTNDALEELFGSEEGVVYVYFHTNNTVKHWFPNFNATFEQCGDELIKPCPGRIADAVLVFGEEKARFGTAISSLKSGKVSDLIVTAGHSSHSGARLCGAVGIYSLDFN